MNNSMTTMNRTQNRGLILVLFVIYVSSLLSVGAEKVRCQQIRQETSAKVSDDDSSPSQEPVRRVRKHSNLSSPRSGCTNLMAPIQVAVMQQPHSTQR